MEANVVQFVHTLTTIAREKGMTMASTPNIHYSDNNLGHDEIVRRLQAEFMPSFNRNGNIELLLFVIPQKGDSPVYHPVKQYCHSIGGIASQCVTCNNVRTKGTNAAFATNLLLKINSKLGGVNVILKDMPGFIKKTTVILKWRHSNYRSFSVRMLLIRRQEPL